MENKKKGKKNLFETMNRVWIELKLYLILNEHKKRGEKLLILEKSDDSKSMEREEKGKDGDKC